MSCDRIGRNGHAAMSVVGPGCVKTCMSRECTELFSLFPSFDGDCQSYSFLIHRNRDRLSTRKSDVGVFTQPGSKPEVELAIADFRFTPRSRHPAAEPACPKSAKTRIRTMAHSISSSAAICIDCGTASPSVFAVLVLMTSSNLVGRSTGRSFGLVPRKTFPA